MRYYITETDSIYSTDRVAITSTTYPQNGHSILNKPNRKIDLGMIAPHQVMVDLILEKHRDKYVSLGGNGSKGGLFFASGNATYNGNTNSCLLEKDKNDPYKIPGMAAINIYAGKLANNLGWNGLVMSDGTACVSGTKSMIDAMLYMEKNNLDRALVLSVEDGMAPSLLYFFGRLGASNTIAIEESTGVLPSAFDETNGGFNVGQGVNVTIIETEKSMLETKSTPIAEIVASSLQAENLADPFSQLCTGEGYVKVMKSLLREANLEPDDITFIKSHGTGTKSNNISERNAYNRVFSGKTLVTSYKPLIGHCMGASSTIELDLALQDCKRKVLTGIPNRTNTDKIFVSEDTPIDPKYVMVLSSGMGNVFAGLIVKPMI